MLRAVRSSEIGEAASICSSCEMKSPETAILVIRMLPWEFWILVVSVGSYGICLSYQESVVILSHIPDRQDAQGNPCRPRDNKDQSLLVLLIRVAGITTWRRMHALERDRGQVVI